MPLQREAHFMTFTSVLFLFRFLPVFLFLYYVAPAKIKNTVLLLGSLFFYAWEKQRVRIRSTKILLDHHSFNRTISGGFLSFIGTTSFYFVLFPQQIIQNLCHLSTSRCTGRRQFASVARDRSSLNHH